MNVVKEQMNVIITATIQLEAISVTVLDLAIDFTPMMPLVKVSFSLIYGPFTDFMYAYRY